LLAKKIDENTGLKTTKGITYNFIIKRDIFFLKEFNILLTIIRVIYYG
jgi:hypothetical protein